MKNAQEIQEQLESLLRKIGFEEFSIQIEPAPEDSLQPITFHISTEGDSRFLIGQYGNNLKALEVIFRLIVRKLLPNTEQHILLDVNEYRSQKNKTLVDMALDAARESLKDKKTVFLRPMSAYERRVIHMALSQESGVTTESVGDGENRKVVIKPVNIIDINT